MRLYSTPDQLAQRGYRWARLTESGWEAHRSPRRASHYVVGIRAYGGWVTKPTAIRLSDLSAETRHALTKWAA